MMKLWSVVLVALLVLAHADADARRLGGGKSMGRQSGNGARRGGATPRASPGALAQNAARPATSPAAAAAPATKPWGAMLGGLAAVLGLAWLAHSLGLGAGFGQFLMIALLAMLAYAVYRMVLRARQGGAGGSGLALQGAGASSPQAAQAPVQYSPHNVGNDASARPWEGSGMAGRQPAAGVVIGSGLARGQQWGVAPGVATGRLFGAAQR